VNDFKRTRLQHSIPSWVQDGSVYFITINAVQRHINQLAKPVIAEAIKDSIQVYKDAHKWHPKLVVIMPDHLHMLVSLNTAHSSIRQIISPWKSYLKRSQLIEWQEGFFEHRIRDRVSLEEKEQYLRMNPVRAGLVEDPEEWPYLWPESSF
jgi:putative transposase